MQIDLLPADAAELGEAQPLADALEPLGFRPVAASDIEGLPTRPRYDLDPTGEVFAEVVMLPPGPTLSFTTLLASGRVVSTTNQLLHIHAMDVPAWRKQTLLLEPAMLLKAHRELVAELGTPIRLDDAQEVLSILRRTAELYQAMATATLLGLLLIPGLGLLLVVAMALSVPTWREAGGPAWVALVAIGVVLITTQAWILPIPDRIAAQVRLNALSARLAKFPERSAKAILGGEPGAS